MTDDNYFKRFTKLLNQSSETTQINVDNLRKLKSQIFYHTHKNESRSSMDDLSDGCQRK